MLMVAASLLVALSTSGSGCNWPGTMNKKQYEKWETFLNKDFHKDF
jgi:hypothetical protein